MFEAHNTKVETHLFDGLNRVKMSSSYLFKTINRFTVNRYVCKPRSVLSGIFYDYFFLP